MVVRAFAGSALIPDRDPPNQVWAAFVSSMMNRIWVTPRLGRTTPSARGLLTSPSALSVSERVPSTGGPSLWSGGETSAQQWGSTGSAIADALFEDHPVVGLSGGRCIPDFTINDLLLVALDATLDDGPSTVLEGFVAGALGTGRDTRLSLPGRYLGLASACIGDEHYAFLATTAAGSTRDSLRVIFPRPDTAGGPWSEGTIPLRLASLTNSWVTAAPGGADRARRARGSRGR